jgi:hypothetical protein
MVTITDQNHLGNEIHGRSSFPSSKDKNIIYYVAFFFLIFFRFFTYFNHFSMAKEKTLNSLNVNFESIFVSEKNKKRYITKNIFLFKR